MFKKTAIMCLVLTLLMLSFSSQLFAEKASFNGKYAAPFGTSPDARVENSVRFTYLNEVGKVSGLDKTAHGGMFALQLAMEDFFGFEIKTIWKRVKEELTFQKCSGSQTDCVTTTEGFEESEVLIGLTPKYKFLNLDWVWGSVSLETLFPLSTGRNQGKQYFVNPGLQFYFDTGDWFGIEVDTAFMMSIIKPNVSVPEGQDALNEKAFTPGAYGRVNFLLKLFKQHFIGLQIEDTIWFRNLDATRSATINEIITYRRDVEFGQDVVDMAFYSNHQLNVGGGYRVNLNVFEGGIGGFVAITDRDKRPGWGMNVDARFTF